MPDGDHPIPPFTVIHHSSLLGYGIGGREDSKDGKYLSFKPMKTITYTSNETRISQVFIHGKLIPYDLKNRVDALKYELNHFQDAYIYTHEPKKEGKQTSIFLAGESLDTDIIRFGKRLLRAPTAGTEQGLGGKYPTKTSRLFKYRPSAGA